MSSNKKQSFTKDIFNKTSRRQLYDYTKENKIKMNIKINAEAETVYGYVYLLMDFQTLFNGIYKLIDDANNQIDDQKEKISVEWDLPSRIFNEKYQEQLVLNSLSKGSVLVDISASVFSGLLVRYIEESVYKKKGNDADQQSKPMEVTIVHNQYIDIPNKQIGQGSLFQKAICTRIENGHKIQTLDVNKYYDEILKKAEIGQNTEENIRRFYKVLQDEGLVPKGVIYDSKGVKKIGYDMNNFIGSRFDKKA